MKKLKRKIISEEFDKRFDNGEDMASPLFSPTLKSRRKHIVIILQSVFTRYTVLQYW